MRRKILRIDSELLIEMLHNGVHPEKSLLIRNGLPKDTRICDVRFKGFDNAVIDILVESIEFEEIKEGEPYPTLGLTAEYLRRRIGDEV